MATSSFTVTIAATAPTQEQADALRLAGLRRYVRQTTPDAPDVATMDEAALLPLAEASLQSFVRSAIVADAASDAELVKAQLVAQAAAQAQALSVQAEVLP